MKLALVYDRLNKLGGAEEILSRLHKLWPNAPWYTSVFSPSTAPFASDWDITTSSLSKLNFLVQHHELVPFLMPYIFEHFDFSSFDVVISVSSAEGKGIITKPYTLHINYCLTPTRYLWSHRDDYLRSRQFGFFQFLLRPLMQLIIFGMQKWDRVAATRPDLMISISEHVKKRVKKYYNRETSVIYPPVNTTKFNESSSFLPPENDYYLVVSRLVSYKRLDLLIKAFNHMSKKLVVIGGGAERNRLRKLAGPSITLKGQVADHELVGYYQNCRAFLAAQEEDFGIVMVEAQAAGKPVIAYNKGGAAEIVTAKTGILFTKQSISAIIRAVDKFETMKFSPTACRQNAARFDKEIFKKQFKVKIEEAWKKHQITLE